jgi:predicted nucleotide-binding protein (sugar kinase/HSP70/actin superfamily)
MSSCIKETEKSSQSFKYLRTEPKQYYEDYSHIEYAKQKDTIFLVGGLTIIQDRIIESALSSLGFQFVALPNPTFESFQLGKTYGNKAQCNPTYFTVGNLIKYLIHLRDDCNIPTDEIVKKYVFLTAGGCGPCRFGMYVTEYKKALKDAGFEGFRITSFEHDKGIFQGDELDNSIIDYTPKFFITLIKAVLLGDLLNFKAHQIRPYEITEGATNKALKESQKIISQAFINHSNLFVALYKCQQLFANIETNYDQVKPKVLITGEFWAAMTQGDGNYNLHKFLEEQGAEVIPQPVFNRLLLSLWEVTYDKNQQAQLNSSYNKTINFSSSKTKALLKLAKYAINAHIWIYAKILKLKNFQIPDMDYLASLAKDYYPIESNGGEGYLEVAHLLESIKHNIAHLVISIKPFGCMPSSSVSDGIQSLVTTHYPQANFISVETSGEGAANFYSRIQMALFKATQQAKNEHAKRLQNETK